MRVGLHPRVQPAGDAALVVAAPAQGHGGERRHQLRDAAGRQAAARGGAGDERQRALELGQRAKGAIVVFDRRERGGSARRGRKHGGVGDAGALDGDGQGRVGGDCAHRVDGVAATDGSGPCEEPRGEQDRHVAMMLLEGLALEHLVAEPGEVGGLLDARDVVALLTRGGRRARSVVPEHRDPELAAGGHDRAAVPIFGKLRDQKGGVDRRTREGAAIGGPAGERPSEHRVHPTRRLHS